jgi:hypothetical protein
LTETIPDSKSLVGFLFPLGGNFSYSYNVLIKRERVLNMSPQLEAIVVSRLSSARQRLARLEAVLTRKGTAYTTHPEYRNLAASIWTVSRTADAARDGTLASPTGDYEADVSRAVDDALVSLDTNYNAVGKALLDLGESM